MTNQAPPKIPSMMNLWYAVDTLVAGRHEEYSRATMNDETAISLMEMLQKGWPDAKSQVPPKLRVFWDQRDELSTYNGIIMRGDLIYIPESKRQDVLKNLHKSHMGMVKTKQLARDTLYWPSMNSQIDDMISKCSTCLSRQNQPPREPMMIHPIPSRPWSKVSSDLFELNGRHFLVLVDYYSNFIEVENLQSLTSKSIIQHMKRIIARHGIMDTLITDNGPQYKSQEFAEFTELYGIQHITSSPLRPQSNGLAEKAVQTIKGMMIKCMETNSDFYLALLDLRNCPREGIGSPCQRLMGRRTRSQIPISEELLQPKTIPPKDVIHGLEIIKRTQKGYYDHTNRPLKPIRPDKAIRLRTPSGWIPAEYITQDNQPRSHTIKAGPHGHTYRRNRDQLLLTNETLHTVTPQEYTPPPPMPHLQRTQSNSPDQNTEPTHQSPIPTARTQRNRKPPSWMKDYVPK